MTCQFWEVSLGFFSLYPIYGENVCFALFKRGKKWKKVKNLSAKTPAGRAARGGKERGNPPPQPTSGMSVYIWALSDFIDERNYYIQCAGRVYSSTNFPFVRCLLRRGIPQKFAAPRCPPRRGLFLVSFFPIGHTFLQNRHVGKTPAGAFFGSKHQF